jgi:hypothetical protein
MKFILFRSSIALCAIVLHVSFASAQDSDLPIIKLASPLGVPHNATTKLTLRGLKLDDVKEVKCADGKSSAKIVAQGNATIPNMQDAKRIGDRQVEIELTIPAEAPQGELALVVVTGKGESQAYSIYVGGEFPLLDDKEDNDGFRRAQAIQSPQIVNGSIHSDKNVDCYAIDGTAGQKLHCEIFADRRGSGLDALLSIYNERGVLLATHDDLSNSRDAKLELTLPAAGKYFLVVQDAHDFGGPAHPYRLVVK